MCVTELAPDAAALHRLAQLLICSDVHELYAHPQWPGEGTYVCVSVCLGKSLVFLRHVCVKVYLSVCIYTNSTHTFNGPGKAHMYAYMCVCVLRCVCVFLYHVCVCLYLSAYLSTNSTHILKGPGQVHICVCVCACVFWCVFVFLCHVCVSTCLCVCHELYTHS